MSMTMKLLFAALIGAGVIVGGGAFYVFVIAPPAVHHAIIPTSYSANGTPAQQNAQIKALCNASGKDAPPVCQQYSARK